MTIAYDVLAVYLALAVWGALLVHGIRARRYRPFLVFGVVILLALNVRYFIEGPPAAIAFFIGIYDVFDNLGLGRDEGAPALATCVDNACTVWGDRYVQHPSWGVAFHDRFLNAPPLRTNLLYGHIALNSIAFVLLHHQLFRPGVGPARARHRLVGRISFAALTGGTVCAVWLASEHGSVEAYGGSLSTWGFYSMSAFVYATAVMGVVSIRRGDTAAHRRWMIRYAGAMWGSFWLFRVLLVVTGPLLRNVDTLSIQLSIWLSAPLGIAIAEAFRTRWSGPRSVGEADDELAPAPPIVV
ncbi:MAG: DUF2306 domain-containing protein [Actinomycetota bacterium]